MSEILRDPKFDVASGVNDEDFNFEEALDASFKRVYTGNIVKGYITAVNSSEAIVDIGTKHTGYVALAELTRDPNLKPSDVVSPGDFISFQVIKINDAEGIVQLSKIKVDERDGLDKVIKARENDSIIEGVVTSAVKGGVLAYTDGVKVFIPASQTGLGKEDKLESLIKKNVKFKIIELSEQGGKAVGSIRAALSAVKKEAEAKFWETAEVGGVYKGAVKSLTKYGAFVDLGGIDGMIHISELSWDRIKHPSEAVKVGAILEVYIKDMNRESGRISLGYKKHEDNPWIKFVEDFKTGDVIKGKVVSITPFGAFVRIAPNIDGLIHISQLSLQRVANVKDVVSVGDEVEAKITEIDADNKKVSVSMRVLLEEAGLPEGEESESAGLAEYVNETEPSADVSEPAEAVESAEVTEAAAESDEAPDENSGENE